ncbi:MAG: VanZ family protein [Pirellulaceae bacterium]
MIFFHRIAMGILVMYWIALFLGTHLPVRGVSTVNDKTLHFLAFAGLSFLLAWAVAAFRPTWRLLVFVLVITVTYGAFDEVTQMLVPRRHADIWDWMANIVGGSVGIACYLICLAALASVWPRIFRHSAQP